MFEFLYIGYATYYFYGNTVSGAGLMETLDLGLCLRVKK